MKFRSKDIYREFLTVKSMIEIYCKKKHSSKNLCTECKKLLEYAQKRLSLCPYYKNKPACKDCSVHCYNEYYAEKIKEVMRFAGPRMLIKHPLLTVMHSIKSIKKRLPSLKLLHLLLLN